MGEILCSSCGHNAHQHVADADAHCRLCGCQTLRLGPVHRMASRFPAPAGWRGSCTCGWETRGLDESEVIGQFLAHAEDEHLTVQPEPGDAA